MTDREFMNKVANGKDDFLQEILDMLGKNQTSFCAIGGLAVNAYAEPVVSLDLDIVIVADRLDAVLTMLKKRYSVTEYANSINVTEPTSNLRIQIQTDMRYQSFINRAIRQRVLGYEMPVAAIEDVLQGKIWAAMDETRRPSKRQKDLSDILRLIEVKGDLSSLIPEPLNDKLFPEK
ncbi:MAG: nucleotidyl transferase AbiEii/AbiGii toxin family protein [Nitrospirae bacterium]|nr:nucleotidyl transferase AbiEii/AbiGii toxin family protein [Nitrospirota bacterium]